MQSVIQSSTGLGPDPIHPTDLAGRTAIITGGAVGIGLEISRALANAGCRVIMINRNPKHGKTAVETIKKETPTAEAEFKECDLGNLAQVRAVFTGLRSQLTRLDFLVLSAGINANQYEEDHDGIDRHFGVNYLGQYYVCNLLWPLLRRTSIEEEPAPRVVFLTSEQHKHAPSDVKFESLEEINDANLGPTRLYARSKLAMILLAKFGLLETVIKPNRDRIYVTTVHPGAVNTDMQQQWKEAYPGLTGKLLTWAMLAIGRDPEQGSYAALWALTSPDIESKDLNGHYFVDPGKEGSESSQASDRQLGENLWTLSEKLVLDKLGYDALIDWNAPTHRKSEVSLHDIQAAIANAQANGDD